MNKEYILKNIDLSILDNKNIEWGKLAKMIYFIEKYEKASDK